MWCVDPACGDQVAVEAAKVKVCGGRPHLMGILIESLPICSGTLPGAARARSRGKPCDVEKWMMSQCEAHE